MKILVGAWVLVPAQHHQCDFYFKWHCNYWWEWRCLVRSQISDLHFIHFYSSDKSALGTIHKIRTDIQFFNIGGAYQALGISRGGRTGQSCSISRTRGMLPRYENCQKKMGVCWFWMDDNLSILSWQLLFCRDLLMENWFFLDAPRWFFELLLFLDFFLDARR